MLAVSRLHLVPDVDKASRRNLSSDCFGQFARSEARHSQKLDELSDSELLMYMADLLSNAPEERLPITLSLVVHHAVGPDIDPACELLHEMGITDFEPEQLGGPLRYRAKPS